MQCSANHGLSRQADPELSLVAELTRERNSLNHQRYSSDRRRSHSRSRVSMKVASATIIAVIKSRPANRKSGQKFLIDSGSEICVIPPSPTMNKSPQSSFSLFAANNAKNSAYGGALRKIVDSELQPLAFFFRKLTSSEKSYSAYDRELLAIYSAIRHFRYMLEARDFTVFTDHKPLTYAFRQKSDKCSHGRSKWPEAQPLKDITAETVAEAFFSSWVSRFGTPAILTTDRGRQFESSLFKALSKLLGVQKCRTTGYHPQANGMIEELHRPLKSAIKCHATERWTEVLPIILLGLRASLKEDILCTPAELVFGTTIRLPGEMFDSSKPDDDVVNFVSKLKSHMQSLHPKPPKHHSKRPVFIHPGLLEATCFSSPRHVPVIHFNNL
ncbi:integrase catalytic domain-containing protein [Trichonephila clavipes]|nr:integrase catalytic domain-containing protein [Trichonephila clavipes]